MLTTRDILLGVLLPLVVGAVVRLILRRTWGDALAVAGGFVAGYVGIFAKVKFPPPDPNDWLLFISLPLGTLGAIDAARRFSILLRGLVLLIVAAASAWLLLWPLKINTGTGAAWIVGSAVVMAIYTMSLAGLSRRIKDVSLPLTMVATAGATGMVLMLSGSQTFGQVGGALGMALVGSSIIAWWFGPAGLSRGLALPLGILLPGLVFVSYHYAALTLTNAILLLIAPSLLWITQIRPVARLHLFKRLIVTMILIAIPLGIAFASAAIAFARDNASGYGEHY